MMIMNNENNKLSRTRKRRIERKIKMDDNLKLTLNKIKSGKKKKNKKIERFRELKILLVRI